MKLQTLDILENCFKEKNILLNNKKNSFELAWTILELNSQVIKQGITILEKYLSKNIKKNMLFDKGLSLIMNGIDPNIIESILLNTILFTQNKNDDLLTNIIALEGVLLIQKNEHPFVSKEIIKSFFGIDLEADFEQEYQKIKKTLVIDEIHKLSEQQVQDLLNGRTL